MGALISGRAVSIVMACSVVLHMTVTLSGWVHRREVTCCNLQVSYTDDRGGYGSELDDEEAERREKAAKQELVPAFMESQEGYDDEVERVLGHRYTLLSPAAA